VGVALATIMTAEYHLAGDGALPFGELAHHMGLPLRALAMIFR
jgi:hypothetical protein